MGVTQLPAPISIRHSYGPVMRAENCEIMQLAFVLSSDAVARRGKIDKFVVTPILGRSIIVASFD